jgi:hypothetical protein
VSIDARVGATVPALGGLARGLLGVGTLLLVIGVLLVVLALRRRSAQYVGPPIGGRRSPPWTPPAPVDRISVADYRSASDVTHGGT